MHKRVELSSIGDSTIVLQDSFIISSSIFLQLDSSIRLTKGVDYSVVDTNSEIQVILSPSLRALLFGGNNSRSHFIDIEATTFPTSLKRTYSFFKNAGVDTITNNPVIHSQPLVQSEQSTPSSLRFTKNGGITRGLQVGSSQDATFTNSFNLTFSGALADDFSFKGALSEESTPLQPEGNTQTLRDIDRIYIELRARNNFAATIGDHQFTLRSIRLDSLAMPSRYDNINRKVLGASATVQGGPTAVLASYSITKGKFTTNTFDGLDGVQGPYRLTGKNGERAIIAIAGTEKIYIDGQLLVRGEQNDYVIDYGLAEIRFTAKRIITAASRLTVDFEYTDEQYSRSLFAAKQATSLFNDAVLFTTSYLREGDDQDNPRELTLSDSDRTILKSAGSDPLKAAKSGVVFVGVDSLGKAKGYYVNIDSIINGSSVRLYRYQPFDSINAVYAISFGRIGVGKGSYIRKSIGEYSYVGGGNGDYDTLVFLPLPQLHQSFSSKIAISPMKGLIISGEGALSNLLQNRFAAIDPIDGRAYTIEGNYVDTLAQDSAGRSVLQIEASSIYSSSKFLPFDRIRSVESMRQYGIESSAFGMDILGTDERENRLDAQLQLSSILFGASVGNYSLGASVYDARHLRLSGGFTGDNLLLPTLTASFDRTGVTDSARSLHSDWQSLSIFSNKKISSDNNSYTPSLQLLYTERKSTDLLRQDDSLVAQSFRYTEITPAISFAAGPVLSLNALYKYRTEDSARGGQFAAISHSFETQFAASVNTNNFNGRFDIGFHSRAFIDSIAKYRAGGDNNSLLLHLVPRYHTSDNAVTVEADYQASEQRSAPLQRLFFPVQAGQGNYTYVGDLNNNGKQDNEEFQPARYSDQGNYILLTIPSEILTPTVDLRTSLRFRFTPSRLSSSNTLHFLSPLSLESFIRFEENSTDPVTSNIYFLHFSKLFDSLSIRGLKEYQQDLYLFESDPTSFRLRWHERTGASNYTTGIEHYYHRDISLLTKLHLADELTNENTISYDNDNITSNEFSSNRPQHSKRYRLLASFAYVPFASALGTGVSFTFSKLTDPLYLQPSGSFLNAQTVTMRYALSTQLSLRTELNRSDLSVHTLSDAFLPYGLTEGLQPGITWGWSLTADQEITRGVLLNLRYEGRSEPSLGTDRKITHIGKAEIRASF